MLGLHEVSSSDMTGPHAGDGQTPGLDGGGTGITPGLNSSFTPGGNPSFRPGTAISTPALGAPDTLGLPGGYSTAPSSNSASQSHSQILQYLCSQIMLHMPQPAMEFRVVAVLYAVHTFNSELGHVSYFLLCYCVQAAAC